MTSDAISSKTPRDRFSFLLEEVNTLSTVVAGHGAQLSILNDQIMVTRCQMYEERCGRINQDNLDHFLIMGAPYYPLSEQLQALLKKQVNIPSNTLLRS